MFHNDSLPAELTNLETRLRSLPLPTARLSREATLYQCGWAAAEAHYHDQQSQRGWIWKATSAVLAASVVVLSILQVKEDAARDVAETFPPVMTVDQAPGKDVVADQGPVAPRVSQSPPLLDFAIRFAPDDRSLLAVRDRALRGVLPELSQTAEQGDGSHRRPKTRRELLDELIERNLHS